MKRYLPITILCANDTCQMAGQCLRHLKYNEEKESKLTLQIVNTSLLDITAEGCEYLHIPRQVMEAHGFKKMYESVPQRYSRNIWRSFPRCGSRRQFYRMLSGEVPLSPEHQEEIIAFFASHHADTTPGFDAYEEVTV